jgi:hypothetical protein
MRQESLWLKSGHFNQRFWNEAYLSKVHSTTAKTRAGKNHNFYLLLHKQDGLPVHLTWLPVPPFCSIKLKNF